LCHIDEDGDESTADHDGAGTYRVLPGAAPLLAAAIAEDPLRDLADPLTDARSGRIMFAHSTTVR
jgi:hypothetical protein